MEDFISHIELFQGIADPGLNDILRRLPVRKFPKGMLIFDQGEKSDEVYVVVSGSVEIVGRTFEGSYAQIAQLESGSLFGEFSFFTGAPRSSAAIPLEDCQVIEISSAVLHELHRRYPEVQERLTLLYRSRVLTNILQSSKLFASLPKATVEDLAEKMSLKVCEDGEEILKEGSSGLELIVIKRGTVAIKKKKGKDTLFLGELRAGDVLGEMAIITGEPRSASAFSQGPCEIMVLPGPDFQRALEVSPELLHALEDVVRSRAEETRKALDALVDDVVGDSWSDVDEETGIQVSSLKVAIALQVRGENLPGTLVSVSRKRWTFEANGELPALSPEAAAEISFFGRRMKSLVPLTEEPLPAQIVSSTGRHVVVGFGEDPTITTRTASIVTELARARFRLFIYPQYDVEKLQVSLLCHLGETSRLESAVSSLSQTNAFIKPIPSWEAGSLEAVVLLQKGENLLSTRAVNLGIQEERQEIQFEYETGQEKSDLEEILRNLSKELGYHQVASYKPPATTQAQYDLILTKSFPSPQLFLKTYMGSMEGGLLNVEAKDRIHRGKAVRINTSVGSRKSRHRFVFTGLVRQWNEGVAEVELDDLSPSLKDKIDQICRKLIEERSAASWEKRKQAIAAKGVEGKRETTAVSRVKWGVAATLAIALGWWAMMPSEEGPSRQGTQEVRKGRVSSAPRDEVLTLKTEKGEVTVRSSKVRSLKIKPDEEGALLTAGGKKYDLAPEAMASLSAFQKQQLERFREMRRKN